ncbi:MAG: DNA-3-methyladenine glycosylase [Rhodospirillales bacterium]|nr:DNA-3-methyladenine glycosylase [Rhodospirillales bacterium]
MNPRPPRSFYRRDAVTVARELLGLLLVRQLQGKRLSGWIVETEAYLGVEDLAAHTVGGRRTARNASMWGDGGHAYVYFTYGMHYCCNVVAGRAEQPIAVLLRSLQPWEGVQDMRIRRLRARRDTDLCSGPAKLTQALAIDRGLDGTDLVDGPDLFIERPRAIARPWGRIVASSRIGVQYAGAWASKPLRFHFADNPHVSRP